MSDEYIVKEQTVGKYTVKVHYDHGTESPRTDGGLGTMVAWMERYNSPDEHDFSSPLSFEETVLYSPDYIVLPLFKYEHGQVAFSTRTFVGRAQHAEWDSGQVGWIYTSKDDALYWFGRSRMTAKLRERVESVLRGEVDTYSAWANGEVFYFCVEDAEGEIVSSSGGFYNADECFNEGILEAKYHNGN